MSPIDDKDERISLRINSKLKEEMQRWAASKGLTLSSVVTRFFRNVLAHERNPNKGRKAL